MRELGSLELLQATMRAARLVPEPEMRTVSRVSWPAIVLVNDKQGTGRYDICNMMDST